MDLDDRIRRLEEAVAVRPEFGVANVCAVTTLVDPVRCTTDDGAWCVDTDLPEGLGGSSSAPTPIALVRAALGSCMAMSYRLRAARHGVPVRSIRVTVETEGALAGMLDATSVEPPGFRSIRYHVDIESPAPHADVMRIIDEGDALSPVLDVLTTAMAVHRTVAVANCDEVA
jgi:uncharacterized OsmC-like protein